MFVGYWLCGNGDLMYLVVKRKIPEALASIGHYCSSLKGMTWKHMASHINNSNHGHTQSDKNMKIASVSPSKNTNKKEKEKKKSLLQSFLRYTQTQEIGQ